MRVFVTGATGFIGSAIVQELIGAGHQVAGLARNDAAVESLARLGVEAHRGELSDIESLTAGARASEGVIHMAFIHDFSAYSTSVETDRRAVEALAEALEGSGKPLVIASGTLMVAHGRPATERDAPLSEGVPRAASEAAVLAAAGRGVRGAVVRLPPPVHDRTRAGLITRMTELARDKGISAYVGDGENLWPAVHRLDAARLFCLALAKAEPGSRLHAVAEEGIPMRTIAEAIGERLGVPVRGLGEAEAAAHFEWLAPFVPLHNPTSSALTREALGWTAREVGLLDDLRESVFA
ncbi:MAG: SDR family oxidoreductase [Caulobacterales bacterium]